MDTIRFGLAIRALRRRRGWTQADAATRAGISQSAISRVERGEADRLTHRTLDRVAGAVGARIRVIVLADGENLDRLLDRGHAALVEHVTQLLLARGWEVAPEVTFSIFGERGSIDVLAFHPPTGSLLVIEVKSTIPDVQATLAGIDRKARLADRVARERGWRVRTVSRWLVVPDTTTVRRRVDQHAATFNAALPGRTVALRRWAAKPTGAVAGIMFLPCSPETGQRGRPQVRSGVSPTREPRGG
jgi:transcriptional regulator with XRE-family HTH domain